MPHLICVNSLVDWWTEIRTRSFITPTKFWMHDRVRGNDIQATLPHPTSNLFEAIALLLLVLLAGALGTFIWKRVTSHSTSSSRRQPVAQATPWRKVPRWNLFGGVERFLRQPTKDERCRSYLSLRLATRILFLANRPLEHQINRDKRSRG